jgi:hypothetical protein
MNTVCEAFALFLANQHPTVIFTVLFAMLGSPFAVTIIVLLTWRNDRRREVLERQTQAALLETYRTDTQRILKSYGEHVTLLSAYYERNVELVKSWQQIAEGFQTTVVLNTQKLTELCTVVETNQFCPHVRITKEVKYPKG